jgi:hypothetical protein
MQDQDSNSLSREKIKAVLIEVHRENQVLWIKWFNRISSPAEKSGLYRYREGFDTAILNLAQRFQVNPRPLKTPPLAKRKKEKAKIISLEKIVILPDEKGVNCPHCKSPLFKKGRKFWHCPVCDVDFHIVEEEK